MDDSSGAAAWMTPDRLRALRAEMPAFVADCIDTYLNAKPGEFSPPTITTEHALEDVMCFWCNSRKVPAAKANTMRCGHVTATVGFCLTCGTRATKDARLYERIANRVHELRVRVQIESIFPEPGNAAERQQRDDMIAFFLGELRA